LEPKRRRRLHGREAGRTLRASTILLCLLVLIQIAAAIVDAFGVSAG
jgi:hypothetical protein